jgi:hypothetical protein
LEFVSTANCLSPVTAATPLPGSRILSAKPTHLWRALNWLNPGRDPDKAWMKTEVLVQANTTQSQTYANNDQFRFREAFIEMGNVLASTRRHNSGRASVIIGDSTLISTTSTYWTPAATVEVWRT